jgi:exonuclease VII small subunit
MGRTGKKRTLEQTSKGDSPPTKMANKQQQQAKVDEILARLTSIEDRFVSLETRFTQMQEAMGVISSGLKEIEKVKAEVASVMSSCEGFQRLEIENKKRSVLIRGLRFGSTKKYETRMETKVVLAGFFDRLGVTPHLVDFQRLGGMRDNEDGSKVSVRVQFVDVDQKFDLFDKLRVMGKEMPEISVLTDYPVFQLQEFKHLSGAAFALRRDNPGTKTRVVPKGLGLLLQRRANAADKWTAVSVPEVLSSSSME